MQDKSIHDGDESLGSQVEKRRISDHRLRDLLLVALRRPARFSAILIWRALGKKLRARGRLEGEIAGLPFAHERWVADAGRRDLHVLLEAQEAGRAPRIVVHLHVSQSDSQSHVRAALQSISKQSASPLAVLVTLENGASLPEGSEPALTVLPANHPSQVEGIRAALTAASEHEAEWLVPLAPKGRLPRFALAAYGAHLCQSTEGRQAGVLYGDEGDTARLSPRPQLWLKPKWDSRMALSQDYVTKACALAVNPAIDKFTESPVSAPKSLYELILLLSETRRVEHVQRITALVPCHAWLDQGEDVLGAVQRFAGPRADEVEQGVFGTVSVRFALPDPLPSVSVIVATRDRVELLRTCVEGVLHKTDYAELDLIIADNESVEAETLEYMEEVSADPRVQVVRWPHPFNYSAINNFAASHANGEYLCLLNNDIEVLEPDWLSEMVREALQPGVGAVGARLLYPDRSIQHAGVAIGIGNAAGHAHRGLDEGEPGYFAQAHIARGASAVTAACLLVAKRHFEAVGGLDEEALAVAYNDVDLCLKLQQAGLSNIYAPRATLIHHESKSRGLDFDPVHLERYMRELSVLQERWKTARVVDPWHHPRLSRADEDYRGLR